MNNQTFTEFFCVKHKISHDDFVREVFNRSLYPHARLLKWLLIFYDPYYFDPDHELIASAGAIGRVRDFVNEAYQFNIHPANCGWLRRKLRLRVSTQRLRAIIRETLGYHTAHVGSVGENFTAVPFKRPMLAVDQRRTLAQVRI